MSTTSAAPPPGVDPIKWNAAIASPRDAALLTQLGSAYYAGFLGPHHPFPAETDAAIMRAFAELFTKAFPKLDKAGLAEMKSNLEGLGTIVEAGLWENPSHAIEGHETAEWEIKRRRQPTLLELLQVGHDLENYIRPNLMRIVWCLRIGAGENLTYGRSQLNAYGETGSPSWAISKIIELAPKATFLSKDSGDVLESLARDMESRKLGDMRNWIAHRDFFIGEKSVIFDFHPVGGTNPGTRYTTTRTEVTNLRREVLGFMAVLFGAKTMFLLQTLAYAGDIQPFPFTKTA